ncbi:hypothetical protein BDZ91DRAFT_725301 [Kalaharituber pfeilii]|nr:hypothetical protein BDZ91DRAFT_725301 [Kalaharituber pfeilii]
MNTTTSKALHTALINFKAKLSEEQHKDFAQFGSIDEVYRCAKEIQEQQKKKGLTRNLQRLKPYIEGLTQYAKVIDVFVQAKPEIMALVWGSTRFILQIASAHLSVFDKILDALERIGENLPRHQRFEGIFNNNARMHRVIGLMYEDILAFHAEALKFFHNGGIKQAFFVHSFEKKIDEIVERLERHKLLVDGEAVAAHVEAVNEDRQRQLTREEEQRREGEERHRQQLQSWLQPVNYEAEVEYISREFQKLRTVGLPLDGEFWLLQLPAVRAWMGLESDGKQLLWLTGIPGAGKTFLAYRLLQHLRKLQGITADCICFAFLKNEQANQTTYGAVIRTFIFQLLLQTPPMVSYLYHEYQSRKFQAFHSPTNSQDLEHILEVMLEYVPGSTYVILDGLDEAEIDDREMILSSLLMLLSKAKRFRILISSRNEFDIYDKLRLGPESGIEHIEIGNGNAREITEYVQAQGQKIHQIFSADDETHAEVDNLLAKICHKAAGMFLWVRLIVYEVLEQTTLEGLQEVVGNLPAGLDAAYQRILDKINRKQNSPLGQHARRILQWVLCSKRPLRKQEIEHALAIRQGDKCFDHRRRLFRRLEELCGPILTVDSESVRLVHFSAYQYLTSEASGPFIQPLASHVYVASICITYLLFTCFKDSLNEVQIDKYIYSGEYVLLDYVFQNWILHVRDATADHGCKTDTISALMEQVEVLLKHKSLMGPESGSEAVMTGELARSEDFPLIRIHSPKLYGPIYKTYAYTTLKDWQAHITGNYPLTLQETIERLRQRFQALIISSSQHELSRLTDFYGPKFFKCPNSVCSQYWDGFTTKTELDAHLESHSRPFKCSLQSCDFSAIGFITQTQLNKHVQEFHQNFALEYSKQGVGNALVEFGPHMLFDAVVRKNVELVKQLCSQLAAVNGVKINQLFNRRAILNKAIQDEGVEIVLAVVRCGARGYIKGKWTPAAYAIAGQATRRFRQALLDPLLVSTPREASLCILAMHIENRASFRSKLIRTMRHYQYFDKEIVNSLTNPLSPWSPGVRCTPILYALTRILNPLSEDDLVKEFIRAGADLTIQGSTSPWTYKTTPLHWISDRLYIEFENKIIPNTVYAIDEAGYSALHVWLLYYCSNQHRSLNSLEHCDLNSPGLDLPGNRSGRSVLQARMDQKWYWDKYSSNNADFFNKLLDSIPTTKLGICRVPRPLKDSCILDQIPSTYDHKKVDSFRNMVRKLRHLGVSEGPTVQSNESCQLVYKLLSQFILIPILLKVDPCVAWVQEQSQLIFRSKTTITRILDYAEFWRAQPFELSPGIKYCPHQSSWDVSEQEYVVTISSDGKFVRHISFDIQFSHSKSNEGSHDIPVDFWISIIRKHPQNPEEESKILYWCPQYISHDIVERYREYDGTNYASIDWNYTHSNEDIRDWLRSLRRGHILGFRLHFYGVTDTNQDEVKNTFGDITNSFYITLGVAGNIHYAYEE